METIERNIRRTYMEELPWGRIEVNVEHADLSPDHLFCLGARNNSRRPFLFVSHVLGKHLPADPIVMLDTYERLASRIPGDLPEPIAFIGMAETATALGQGIFEAWLRRKPDTSSIFLHTTRYRIPNTPYLAFEEAHSHAPRLFLHLPKNTRWINARSMVLIDDEISTGRTFINLTQAFRKVAVNIERIHLAAITDFTGRKFRSTLSKSFEYETTVGSLLQGQWSFISNGSYSSSHSVAQAPTGNEVSITDGGYGRLGKTDSLKFSESSLAKIVRGISKADKVLILGTGEFMFPAFVLANELKDKYGLDVQMHATTRSPIMAFGPIRGMHSFRDNYGEGISNYLYNWTPGNYQHVLICHETPTSVDLVNLARALNGRLLHFQAGNKIEETSVC
jgi:hypothetical protein